MIKYWPGYVFFKMFLYKIVSINSIFDCLDNAQLYLAIHNRELGKQYSVMPRDAEQLSRVTELSFRTTLAYSSFDNYIYA